ncbi:hypothetical protein A3A60_04755 [Candidatus Curtissbacteria bacterium RIFCSPLOWO2_01_FULL_42_26]|uniref:Glutamyl-tRNA amidotransferase n=1 Tax=Candidatus Curtissbacteria bacterium RIFCSPLOWO2_01_FULL_42_26 TaxID=1797729 RepID=A0A1F5I1T1_9BACT|nr:MAG: hypothetical protein A3A60_04755 [Candidatus Curtissbacteria bacterium RIFCSPLOWO2_01_FULL_42_26]
MADLVDKIREDLDVALKGGDGVVVSTLRFLLSAVQNVQIEKKGDLDDEQVVEIIRKDAKEHKESIEAFEKGERADLVQKETKELEVLEKYLPAQMPAADIEKIVDEVISATGATSIADMGKVMGQVMAKVKSRADGNVVSQIVKGKLAK